MVEESVIWLIEKTWKPALVVTAIVAVVYWFGKTSRSRAARSFSPFRRKRDEEKM